MPTRAKAQKKQTTAKKQQRRRKAKPISLPPKRRPRTEQEKHDAKVRKERAKIKEETHAKLELEYDVTLTSAERYTMIQYLLRLGRARTPTETRLLKMLNATKGRKPDAPRTKTTSTQHGSRSTNHIDPMKKLRKDNKDMMATLERIAGRRPREDNAGRMFYRVRSHAQEMIEVINDRKAKR